MFKSLMPNLMVESVDDTVKFYVEKLSFALVQSVPNEMGKLNFAIVSRGDCVLSFQLKENLVEEYHTLATNKISPSLTLFFTVDNIEQIYQELIPLVKIEKEMHTTFYGTKEFAFTDNNGNILTIAGE